MGKLKKEGIFRGVSLASPYNPDKHGDDLSDFLYSNKIDGMRAWWCTESCTLYTRNNKKIFIPAQWEDELTRLGIKFDGELYYKGKDTKDNFRKTMSICRRTVNFNPSEWDNVSFYVFDIIEDSVGYTARYKKMKKILPDDHSFIKLVKHLTLSKTSNIMEKHSKAVKQGFEGIMLRRKDSCYEYTRSTRNLLKIKKFETVDAKLTGYQKGNGKYLNAMGALFLTTENGIEVKVGGGFDDKQRKNFKELFPIGCMIEFKYFERLSSGKYRFPIFVTRRFDKE
jgi:DNA ligase-1